MAHPRFGPQILNKIADSWPIRWAAKLTASVILRGKYAIEEQGKKMASKVNNPSERKTSLNEFNINRFKQTFADELQKEMGKAKRGPKKDQESNNLSRVAKFIQNTRVYYEWE